MTAAKTPAEDLHVGDVEQHQRTEAVFVQLIIFMASSSGRRRGHYILCLGAGHGGLRRRLPHEPQRCKQEFLRHWLPGGTEGQSGGLRAPPPGRPRFMILFLLISFLFLAYC